LEFDSWQEIAFLFSIMSREALGPLRHPAVGYRELFSRVEMTVATYLHLVPRSRIAEI
jgi:hypothetical protein